MMISKIFSIFLLTQICVLPALLAEDYFRKFAGPIPVKVHYSSGLAVKPMELLGIDPQKGIIFAKMQGGGAIELELRNLKQQNIARFEFQWPKNAATYLRYLANEQYDPRILQGLRPDVYKVMLFLEVPFIYLPIHDDCLTYVRALIAMEQFDEAFYLLSRLNLSKLDDFGYREFSECALELCGKMIGANASAAKSSRALLQRVTIRDDSGDHESYLRLADTLRQQGLYTEAISEYARLTPIVNKTPGSAYSKILEIWPIYCYIKLYEMYAPAAKKDKRYGVAAGKMFNSAVQGLKKLDEDPPDRQSNEYSLYKLIRSLVRIQYARRFEDAGDDAKASEYYRQSVLEVTEGIVNARIGLDWLPESLMMAADAYEKLELNEAARNVYNQVVVFFKETKWEKKSQARLAALAES